MNNKLLKSSAVLIAFIALLGSALYARSTNNWPAFWQAYFVNFCFFLTLSLGALFFVILHHLVHAGWSVVVRRLAEILSLALPLLALLFVPLALRGLPHIFSWATDIPLDTNSAKLMRTPFFLARCGLYFAVWSGLAFYFWRASVRQDSSGAPALTSSAQRFSAPAMVILAFFTGFGGEDLLMTLHPPWQSTIFGVYFFAGCALSLFAALPLLVLALQRSGRLQKEVTPEHYHDLGKLLFTFIFFWAYIGFSQYLLIWYAALPEETIWLARRAGPAAEDWNIASLVLIFGHWMIPFTALLSREMKRRRGALAFWYVWMLAMHYLDLYWLAAPEWSIGVCPFSLLYPALFIGLGGLYLAWTLWPAERHALVPVKDPRLAESLAFENF